MSVNVKKIIIGTRKSQLALWQTNHIAQSLKSMVPNLDIEIKHIVTSGDRSQESGEALPAIGGKGLFTAELEEALVNKTIDIAVHSLKDLPTSIDERFVIAAIPKRAAAADVLVTRDGAGLASLPKGAKVGTSSLRRLSQLKRLRPDLELCSIRGNVGTRINKVKEVRFGYNACLLAEAGLVRLGLQFEVAERFSYQQILPAPGQGALGVQCRSEDVRVRDLLGLLNDTPTEREVGAERSFLNALQAGCNTPVAAFAKVNDQGELEFTGRCLAPDGSKMVEVEGKEKSERFVELGIRMAESALNMGADKILND